MENETTDKIGRCLCGAIGVVAHGPPSGIAACHCVGCRKHTGAPFAVYADYAVVEVRWTGNVRTYEGSPGSLRGFCPECGSTLWFQGANLPDMIHVHVGLFDDAAQFVPARHEHVQECLPWLLPFVQ